MGSVDGKKADCDREEEQWAKVDCRAATSLLDSFPLGK
jgi:hypothetical protein